MSKVTWEPNPDVEPELQVVPLRNIPPGWYYERANDSEILIHETLIHEFWIRMNPDFMDHFWWYWHPDVGEVKYGDKYPMVVSSQRQREAQ